MAIVPENTSPRIDWYRSRLEKWAENAALLGLSEEEVALLQSKVEAAAEKLMLQRQAQSAAQSATSALHGAMEELSQLGASMISRIKAQAMVDGDGVYPLAFMPAPAKKSPIGAPGSPYRFETKLRPLGQIEFKWKCDHPKGSEGMMYEIQRQLGDGPQVHIATVGKKRFVDPTVPPGTARVTYYVTAIRSTRRGQQQSFNVFLGSTEGAHPVMFQTRKDDLAAA